MIETPAIFGPYSRKGSDRRKLALGMADSMAMLWYVIGRLDSWLGMNGTRVVRVKASGGKSDHHRTVQVIWPHLPTTKTGPAEDQRDAVWLGLRYLTDARRAG
ncbi:MAG: hypothetical protein SFV24_12940 [Gemmatimonadales bacterium]|nr:hypothetical protein [Gemmatimonadales bacterium]